MRSMSSYFFKVPAILKGKKMKNSMLGLNQIIGREEEFCTEVFTS